MANEIHNKHREPLKLGKKRHIFEVIVEAIIRGLSFVSIGAIVLIFIFVFREASPIFFGKSDEHTEVTAPTQQESSSQPTGEIKQEVYDPLAQEKPTETKIPAPKKENISFENKGKIEQEVYDPLVDEEPAPKKVEEKKEVKAATPEKPKDKNISFENKGKIAQEVYDPLAEDEPTSAKQEETPIVAEVAEPIDSASIAIAKIEEDSIAKAEQMLGEERKDATSVAKMFTGTNWQPVGELPKYGFVPLFIGSLKVTLIALLFAAPIAILAAIFTSTFAPRRLREVIKPVIELLAGLPSVVIGFFALIVMATYFQDIFGYASRLNSFVGGIAMGLAVIPIIYTISEDALTAVPQSLRDASTALGATKWQTAVRVVLPAAIPGVFASLILGFGRAFGETMIALMATGNAAITSAGPFDSVRTFAATIGAEMAEVVFGDEHYNVLFLIGAMLFVFTFTLNSIVEFYIRKRLIKRIQGK